MTRIMGKKYLPLLMVVFFLLQNHILLCDEQEIDILIKGLGDQDIYLVEKALAKLVSYGDKAVEKLLQHIDDPDRNIASRCIESLGKIGNQTAVEPLINKLFALSDSKTFTSRFLRIVTINALGELRSSKAIPILKKIGNEGTEYDNAHSLVALSKIGHRPSMSGLIDLLKDDNKNIRYIAAESLGELNMPESIPALIDALGDKEWFVRDAAIESLGKLGAVQALPLIEPLLDDPVPFVRKTAYLTIRKLSLKEPSNPKED